MECIGCIVAKLCLFGELSKGGQETLSSRKTTKVYEVGQEIADFQVAAGGIFLIKSGIISISCVRPSGDIGTIRLLSKGEFFGLDLPVPDNALPITYTAAVHSEVCALNRSDFMPLLSSDSELVAKRLVAQLLKSHHELYNAKYKPTKALIARCLLVLNEHFEADGAIKISHNEIATIVGTTRETVSRFLAQLRKEEVLNFDGRKMIVKNAKRLRALAELER